MGKYGHKRRGHFHNHRNVIQERKRRKEKEHGKRKKKEAVEKAGRVQKEVQEVSSPDKK